MKKKIILFVSVLTCVFSLCACGSDEKTADYNGHSYQELQMTTESMAASLDALTDDEIQQYYSYYASTEEGAAYAGMLEDWMEVKPEIGDFVGYSDFEINKAGKTLSCEAVLDYSARDIKLVYVYNANSMEVEAINVEQIYTLGEQMSKAGMNTLMGIGTVFFVLVLISLIIYCFNIIPYLQKKFNNKDNDGKQVVVAEREAAPVVLTDDLELIAVISAAIAASTGASTDDFVVRSIKRR